MLQTTTGLNLQISGLTAGVIYQFKVEARNQYGYSDFSDTLSLLCAFIPEIPSDVVTSIEADQMRVSWSLSTANGSPITAFKVFVQEIGTTTYTLENIDCDGTAGQVISQTTCLINVSTLLATPYNVDGGDSIYAKVSASNVYGESA